MSTSEVIDTNAARQAILTKIQCTVCDQHPLSNEQDQMLRCNECRIQAHQSCLEEAINRKTHGDWRCGRCVLKSLGKIQICRECLCQEGALVMADIDIQEGSRTKPFIVEDNIVDNLSFPQLKHIKCIQAAQRPSHIPQLDSDALPKSYQPLNGSQPELVIRNCEHCQSWNNNMQCSFCHSKVNHLTLSNEELSNKNISGKASPQIISLSSQTVIQEDVQENLDSLRKEDNNLAPLNQIVGSYQIENSGININTESQIPTAQTLKQISPKEQIQPRVFQEQVPLVSPRIIGQSSLESWGFAKRITQSRKQSHQTLEEEKSKQDAQSLQLLGKRKRTAKNQSLKSNSPPHQNQTSDKGENDNSLEDTYDKPDIFKRQRKNDDPSAQDDIIKGKLSKSLEVSFKFAINIFQSDPCAYLVKDIIIPLMFQIDKLQVLKRDKQMFQISLEAKDLKQISKERRFEMINKKTYYDFDPVCSKFLLTVEYEKPVDQMQFEQDLIENDQQNLDNNEQMENTDINNLEESGSPDSKSPDKDDGSDEVQDQNNVDPELNLENDNEQLQKPKRKKRGKAGLTMTKKKVNISKTLINLPAGMCEYSWIENTQQNKEIIEVEKIKQSEIKKSKEILKANKLQLEMKSTEIDEKMIYQDETVTIVQVDNGLNQEQKKTEEKKLIEDEKMTDVNRQAEQIINIEVVPEVVNSVEQPWVYRSRSEIKTLDDIKERVDDGYYPSLELLVTDIELLIKNVIKDRCVNKLAKVYLTTVLLKSIQLINSKNDEYKQRWRNYFEARFAQNETFYPKVKQWWKAPGAKREYNTLEDYKIVTTFDSNQKMIDSNSADAARSAIKEKMKTTKVAVCQGDCCSKIEDLGPFKLNNDVWDTTCNCRLKKVECSNLCGCDINTCKNRQMSLKQSLKLGEDIIERTSWGIDMCTAVNLMALLPRDVPQKLQSEFVEKKLVYAIQQQGDIGYDVRRALKFMTKNYDIARYSQMDRDLAAVVLAGVKGCRKSNQDHFRVHSKGIGIFCEIKEGIKASNIIIEYFGEIYQPWTWYEKQDVLKQGQNKSQLSKELPDFYNITYERHQDDPQGYDILFVDPILYGNYSSRLSHSCNPNCSTIIHIRNGEYSIGMYAIKDINYGDELCFNYCSLTESEKEYEAAVCLCGTEVCQGKFLQLASDKKHLTILKQYHTFVDRNYLVWKACRYPDITLEDANRLNDFGLKSSVIDGLPNWLKKWASLLCEYIQFEEQQYPKVLKNDFPHLSEDDLKIDAKNLRDGKLWNVAITIDKVMQVLRNMGTMEAPIRNLPFKERYMKLWDDENSLKSSLIDVISKIEECNEKNECQNLIMREYHLYLVDENQMIDSEQHYEDQFNKVRAIMAQISDILRSVQSQRVTIAAFCDVLWMYANTETYFTPNENYKKCKGEEIKIRKCDVRCESGANQQGSLNPVDQEKTVYKGCKEYDPGYIWGQLVGWFKQTVDKPNASLSADRRGTLSMPDLESFIVSSRNQNTQKSSKGAKRKSKSGNEEDVNDDDDGSAQKSGTKSRPIKSSSSFKQNSTEQHHLSNQSDNISSAGSTGLKSQEINAKFKEPLTRYPHKKHQTRQAFLENWGDNFSKQCKFQQQFYQAYQGMCAAIGTLRTDKGCMGAYNLKAY